MNATQYLARQAAPQPAAIPTPPPNRRQQRQRPIPAQVRDLLQEHDDLSPAVRLVAITIASYADGKGWDRASRATCYGARRTNRTPLAGTC